MLRSEDVDETLKLVRAFHMLKNTEKYVVQIGNQEIVPLNQIKNKIMNTSEKPIMINKMNKTRI